MLDGIVKGKEKTNFILIEDTFEKSGLPLLPVFLSEVINREEAAVLVCVEREEKEWRGVLPPRLAERLTYVNATRQEDIKKLVTGEFGKETSQASVVVIDSLASLCLFHDSSLVCSFIHSILQDAAKQVVGLLHADCVSGTVCDVLGYLASCVVRLVAREEATCCTATLLKKLSGKVVKATEQFSITPTWALSDVSDVHQPSLSQKPAMDNQTDPAAGLTFNLRLTDEQQSARSKVALPYTISAESQKQILEHGHSQIFYQPDEADDFDEEDPDDDLDI